MAPPVATTAATTCVAIPCVPQHWRLLPRALRSITLQTRKANFIVVILSHVNEKSAECTQLRQMLKSWVPRARLACVHKVLKQHHQDLVSGRSERAFMALAVAVVFLALVRAPGMVEAKAVGC